MGVGLPQTDAEIKASGDHESVEGYIIRAVEGDRADRSLVCHKLLYIFLLVLENEVVDPVALNQLVHGAKVNLSVFWAIARGD